jgi:hypothetical protein
LGGSTGALSAVAAGVGVVEPPATVTVRWTVRVRWALPSGQSRDMVVEMEGCSAMMVEMEGCSDVVVEMEGCSDMMVVMEGCSFRVCLRMKAVEKM